MLMKHSNIKYEIFLTITGDLNMFTSSSILRTGRNISLADIYHATV